ncbi:MAG: 30S ribosomal protein S6, partial [Bacilli bacterium]
DLAYEINDLKKGYYVKFRVEATPEAVSEYNRICNIREDIIRHILVRD